MWFLRLKINPSTHKKLVAIAKIALLILFVHAIIALVFFYDRSTAIALTLSATRKPTASVTWSSPSGTGTTSADGVAKGTAAPKMPATTTIATTPAVKAPPKTQPKETKTLPVEKKQDKKPVPEKKVAAPKEPAKKEPTKTEKQAPKKEEKPVAAKQATPAATKSEQPVNNQALEAPIAAQQATNAAVWQEEELFELIGKYWHVPTGSFEECVVTVKVAINKEGSLSILDMQRSKALIFDSAVQETLFTISWPQWLYGRELNLTFTS